MNDYVQIGLLATVIAGALALMIWLDWVMERRGYCLTAHLCTATVDGKPRPGYRQ